MCFKKIYFSTEFIIARLIIYGIFPLYYLYLVFVNKTSCSNGNSCILCNMKTAVWKLLHFNIKEAIALNPLVLLVLLAIIYTLFDICLIIKYLKK